MDWIKDAPGRYASTDGYTIERERSPAQFGYTHTVWHVEVNGERVTAGSSLAKAKTAAVNYRERVANGLCYLPTCRRPATGPTLRIIVSLPGDGSIDTCDECHRRLTGRHRTER